MSGPTINAPGDALPYPFEKSPKALPFLGADRVFGATVRFHPL